MGGSALGRFGWERAAQTFDMCTLLLNRQCYWSVAPARIFWLPFARDAMANSYLMATRAYLTTSSYQYLTAQSYLFVGPLELIWLTAHSYLYDGMWSSVRVRKSFKYWTCASWSAWRVTWPTERFPGQHSSCVKIWLIHSLSANIPW